MTPFDVTENRRTTTESKQSDREENESHIVVGVKDGVESKAPKARGRPKKKAKSKFVARTYTAKKAKAKAVKSSSPGPPQKPSKANSGLSARELRSRLRRGETVAAAPTTIVKLENHVKLDATKMKTYVPKYHHAHPYLPESLNLPIFSVYQVLSAIERLEYNSSMMAIESVDKWFATRYREFMEESGLVPSDYDPDVPLPKPIPASDKFPLESPRPSNDDPYESAPMVKPDDSHPIDSNDDDEECANKHNNHLSSPKSSLSALLQLTMSNNASLPDAEMDSKPVDDDDEPLSYGEGSPHRRQQLVEGEADEPNFTPTNSILQSGHDHDGRPMKFEAEEEDAMINENADAVDNHKPPDSSDETLPRGRTDSQLILKQMNERAKQQKKLYDKAVPLMLTSEELTAKDAEIKELEELLKIVKEEREETKKTMAQLRDMANYPPRDHLSDLFKIKKPLKNRCCYCGALATICDDRPGPAQGHNNPLYHCANWICPSFQAGYSTSKTVSWKSGIYDCYHRENPVNVKSLGHLVREGLDKLIYDDSITRESSPSI